MQALRDSIDILNGRAGNIVLAKELGLENDALKEAAKNGQTYELIMSKIGGYREAAEATSTSFAGLQQSVTNLLQQLAGTAAMPMFDELKSDLGEIKSLLDSIQARGTATGLGIQLGGLIDGAKQLAGFLKDIASVSTIGQNVTNSLSIAGTMTGHPLDTGALAAQVEANQKIVESLRQQAQQARTGQQIYDACRVTQEAIDRAIQQAATSTGEQKTAAENLVTALETVMQSIGKTASGTHDAAGAAGVMTTALAGSNKELGDMLAKLPAIVSGMKEEANAANLASRLQSAGNTSQKQNILQGERDNILQYINQNAQQLGHGGVVDATSASNVVESYSRDSSNGAVGMPGDSEAVQNIVAAHQKLVAIDQQLAQLARERNDEDTKAAQSATDCSQHEAIFAAQAAGDKTHADQLDRAKDIQQEALQISKDENLSWDDAVKAATEYVDLQNKAKDAADAEKNSKRASAAAGKEAVQAARDQRMEEAAGDTERKTALAVAAIAAIIAMATSHATGGLIPGSPSHKDNRFAHVASGEYVVRTAAVQHYGPDFFHRLNNMSMPRTGFATGGLVGEQDGYTPLLATVSATSPKVKVAGHQVTLIQTRDRSEMLQALQSSDGEKIVVGHIKKNPHHRGHQIVNENGK